MSFRYQTTQIDYSRPHRADDGHFPPFALAAQHGVSLSTALQAVRRLEGQGYARARPRSGYSVAARSERASEARPARWPDPLPECGTSVSHRPVVRSDPADDARDGSKAKARLWMSIRPGCAGRLASCSQVSRARRSCDAVKIDARPSRNSASAADRASFGRLAASIMARSSTASASLYARRFFAVWIAIRR